MPSSASPFPDTDVEATTADTPETTGVRGELPSFPSQTRIVTTLITALTALMFSVGTAAAQPTQSEVCGALGPIGTAIQLLLFAGPAITLAATVGFAAMSGFAPGGHEAQHRYRQRAKYAFIVTILVASPQVLVGILELLGANLGCISVWI
jgi:hypothetical protein